MPIQSGVICLWVGTHASIPSGWTRDTDLDARYPKGTANGVDPGGTGGALTHSHTTSGHQHAADHVHTVPNSPQGTGSTNRDAGSTRPPATHTHQGNPNTTNPTAQLASDTPSTDTSNHEPSYFHVIYISSNGTPSGLPSLAVAVWNDGAGTPTNWNLCDGGSGRPDMRGRFAKGAAALGDGGGSGGGSAHGHGIASHQHGTNFGHNHPDVNSSQTFESMVGGNISGSQAATATQTHIHVLTVGTQATDAITGNTDTAQNTAGATEPPHVVEAFIQNNTGGNDAPLGIICIWKGLLANIPNGWALCDGTNSTPDLRSQFVKGANTLAGIGGTGGNLTHGHTATGHTHAVASHNHTISAANGAGSNETAGAVACATTAHAHSSWSNSGSQAFTSGTGTPTVVDYTDTQPPYYDIAYIQLKSSGPIEETASAALTKAVTALSQVNVNSGASIDGTKDVLIAETKTVEETLYGA